MNCFRLIPRKRFSRLVVCFSVVAVTFVFSIRILSHRLDQFSSDEDAFQDSFEIQGDEESTDHQDHYKEHSNTEQDLILSALSQVGNLPNADFILQHRGKLSNKCGHFPDLYHLEFNNLHWQVQNIRNLTFYLYRAYYDDRPSEKVIRILTMVEEPYKLAIPTVCQLWYQNDQKHVDIQVTSQIQVWFRKWSKRGKYTAYLLTCPIPKSEEEQVPVSVSLVGNNCDSATNNLEIVKNNFDTIRPLVSKKGAKKKKLRFGVCVKGLDFLRNDQSSRLIEWIELLLILGVDKIFFYELSLHPNVKAVLEHYRNLGKIDLTPLTLPGTLPNEPGLRHLFLSNPMHYINKRKTEVIPYNDCLYRNYDKFDYLSVLDTDEIILPKKRNNWEDMITEIKESLDSTTKNKSVTSYCFRNIYFFDSTPPGGEKLTQQIPSHLHMLKHIFRAANYTPPTKFIKCIHSTAKTLLLHNHFPLKCLDGLCKIHHVDYDYAHMQHYRSTCVRDLRNCDDYENSLVQDSTIWKWKEDLIRNVNKTMSEMERM